MRSVSNSLPPGLCPSPALTIEGLIIGLISSHSWLLSVLLLTSPPGSLPSSLDFTPSYLSGCSCSVCSGLLFFCTVNVGIFLLSSTVFTSLDDSIYNYCFSDYQIWQLCSSGQDIFPYALTWVHCKVIHVIAKVHDFGIRFESWLYHLFAM